MPVSASLLLTWRTGATVAAGKPTEAAARLGGFSRWVVVDRLRARLGGAVAAIGGILQRAGDRLVDEFVHRDTRCESRNAKRSHRNESTPTIQSAPPSAIGANDYTPRQHAFP